MASKKDKTKPIVENKTPEIVAEKSQEAAGEEKGVVAKPDRDKILQLQEDLKYMGFDPGPLDGLYGGKTKAAEQGYATANQLDMLASGFREALHDRVEARKDNFPDETPLVTDVPDPGDLQGPSTTVALPIVKKVKGNTANRKSAPRDYKKKQRIQIHQTDFWATAGTAVNMKTNLLVTTTEAIESHPIEACIVKNYADLYHIEVAWVSASRMTVTENGVTYHRKAGVWTAARELVLEAAMVYAWEEFQARGVRPIFVTHRQTYGSRAIDPDPEIAQAAYRIARKHGFAIDFDWVRPSGQSAAKWYPVGCGSLG